MGSPAEELHRLLLETFPQPENRLPVEWLSGCTSAHGDLVQRLTEVVRPLGFRQWHPAGDFPFVVVVDVTGLIRGAAVGMSDIFVRVPRQLERAASAEGACVVEAGPGWYRFAAFDVDRGVDEQIRWLRRWF